MVEVVDHLCFVEREHAVVVAGEDVAVEGPAIGFELLAGVEQVRVRVHHEHQLEGHAPRVTVRVALFYEHWHAPVDTEGDLGVSAAAEHRTGAGVRVQ
ncbi:MAG: hypothetical protein ACRDRO_22095 [Pseudonocardiaceae bacterium]